MKKLSKLMALALLAVAMYVPQAHAGNCDHSWNTASDGSSCGDRAADRREGGN